ncbi:hypothetical protein GCM10010176_020430 [Nonomuraea spiralis]|nr:hypothetical protein GCM10010176_020430 [Nonomuraea spiralis]
MAPALVDEILAETGIKTLRTGIRMPRLNSIMERWVQSCRRPLLDCCLLRNEHHLRQAQGRGPGRDRWLRSPPQWSRRSPAAAPLSGLATEQLGSTTALTTMWATPDTQATAITHCH